MELTSKMHESRKHGILEYMDAPHIRIGKIGEQAVVNHLKRKGYAIHSRNYRKKWGEIDIIARKGDTVHFVEVKTVSYETKSTPVTHGTWLPEENVDRRKLGKLFRTIETWLLEYRYEGEWQLDVASVWLDTKHKQGRVKIIEDIVSD